MRRIEINKYIVADPEICHGQLTFKGTRIMVWQVLELLGAGLTPEEIIKDYFPQLTKKAILSAPAYASQLIKEEGYAVFPKEPVKTPVR